MVQERVERKLAAIVAADIAGYSRLMGNDEEGTLAALKAHRHELIDPTIEAHGGRIVKTTGDGLLIEFPSVVNALRCSLSVQKGMIDRNESVPPDNQIRFRIGINLGDVIVDGDDLFGDGVNIAARLEAMAAPGGICISGAVLEQAKQKLSLDTEDLGEPALKNIEQPVHAYQVVHGGDRRDETASANASSGSGSVDLSAQRRPSLALLPFRNLNGDTENDFIADGIALGIQTLMVQLSGLFLINAVSHQGYRAGEKTAADVARDLPARFVLEGTTQRAGQRVRVTVQLTDVREHAIVWAERYDRELEDIFALQDDITREVISSLNAELSGADSLRIWTRGLTGHGAWEYFLRGVSHIYKFTKADNLRARDMFEKLYALYPDKVHGPSYVAFTYWLEVTRGWADSLAESLEVAAYWAEKAISYKENDGLGHTIMSDIRLRERRHDEALALCEKAVEYRSNCPGALGQWAAVRLYSGDASDAIKSARESLAKRVMCPPLLINLLANAYRDNGQYELSIPAAREAMRLDPSFTDGLVTLCSDYVLAGDDSEARRIAKEILVADPEFSISEFLEKHPYKDEATLQHLGETLHAAGLPE